MNKTDVAIIGAGPAGSIAAALLRKFGHQVTVLERTHFPRFSIGESLLPQCMSFIAEAGLENAVADAGFQYKNGAAFVRNGEHAEFDFRKKFSAGPGTTHQVQRARFDHLLAQGAMAAGATVHFGHSIEKLHYDASDNPVLQVRNEQGTTYHLSSSFVLDASGFGRVLPRLLDLEYPSSMPVRTSVFTHVEDCIDEKTGAINNYDRNKILIAIHPQQPDVWFWLIPFANGRSSVGVVAKAEYFTDSAAAPEQQLRHAIDQCPDLSVLLRNAKFDTAVNKISGYSCNVKSLWGKQFALLGNAGEFLDPVFSSGVTIAMKSASLVAPLVSRHLRHEPVDWEEEYAQPLRLGVETFRAYVDAWYNGTFQDVIFAREQQPEIRSMIASILAGYAWDTHNPFVKEPRRRLNALAEHCR